MANNTGRKYGGRKKGTPNKITGTVKEMINKTLTKQLESLPKLLSELSPKERVEVVIKLLPYLIPKMDVETEKLKEDKKNNFFFKEFELHQTVKKIKE